jgi:hypothetical protein
MKLISAKDLIKRWNADRRFLFSPLLVDSCAVTFDKNGKVIYPKDVFMDITGTPSPYDGIKNWYEVKLPQDDYPLQNKMLQAIEEKVYLDFLFYKYMEKPMNIIPVKNQKKSHPRDYHQKKAIYLAKKFWKKDSDKTRPDMARFLKDKVEKKNGDKYTEKTIKEWIADVDPNPPLKRQAEKETIKTSSS